MKASGSFLGKKQEFFDEALADMEKKYGKAIAK